MFSLFHREIKNSEQAMKIFNSGRGDVWGLKGLWLLYDLAIDGYDLDRLGITLDTNVEFTPKSSEYKSGKHIEFKYDRLAYAVRVTKRIPASYLDEDGLPYYHAKISIKVDGERKLNAKIQQYDDVSHWNILDISLLKTPLSWYHPIQTLFYRRKELDNLRREELMKKYNDQDLWDD